MNHDNWPKARHASQDECDILQSVNVSPLGLERTLTALTPL